MGTCARAFDAPAVRCWKAQRSRPPEDLPPRIASSDEVRVQSGSAAASVVKAKPNQSDRRKLRLLKGGNKGVAKACPFHMDFIDMPPGALGQALAEVVPDCVQHTDAWGNGDVLGDAIWNKLRTCIKKRRVDWLHMTFSANESRPAGMVGGNDQTEIPKATIRIGRICTLVKMQVRAGGQVSLAHPARSAAWEWPSLRASMENPALRTFTGDLCTEGGLHKRPTRWLTNCEWMQVAEQKCPGAPVHPRHLPFGTFCGTLKQQDLPIEFCKRISEDYLLADKARLKASEIIVTSQGILNPFSRQTARQFKESENTKAIGGLRNPHISLVKVPGWMATGEILNGVLNGLFDKHRDVCEHAITWLGSEEAKGFGHDIVCEARHKLCEALGRPHAHFK